MSYAEKAEEDLSFPFRIREWDSKHSRMASLIVEQDIETVVVSLGARAKTLEGKTVLISGGSGFLGSHFLAVLARLNKNAFKRPCTVITLDNYVTGMRENPLGNITDPRFTFLKRDICAPLRLEGPVDYIIHMAGIASPVYYIKYPLETIHTATIGTEHLLQLARKKKSKKFLFFSSSEIYGDPAPEFVPTPESYRGNVSSTGPRACYDESKRLGETLCMVYHRLYRVPVQIVRPFNVYGPGMKQDDRRVIPQFLSCAFAGKPLPIHGSGRQTRSYCYTTDALVGFFKGLLSKKSGEVYNIGSHQGETNLIDLAHMISNVLGRKLTMVKIPYPIEYPPDEPSRRCPDITKARRELSYEPEVDLETGLRRMIAWYQERHGY
jgi:UDP-glucuronate decarboxylase